MHEEYIKNIYKRISLQYHKNVTYKILVHESSQHTMEIDQDMSELPAEKNKQVN